MKIKQTIIDIATGINTWIEEVFGVDLAAVFTTVWNDAKDIGGAAIMGLDNLVRPILE